jgi:pimeloyl-ACP methyl ester carboxylesterase
VSDTTLPRFTIRIDDDVLDDLRSRLRRTRFAPRSRVLPELLAARTDPCFPHPTAPGWEAGVDPDWLRELVAYWADEFDWRAAEARLNAYPQHLVDGTHFVHLRRDPDRLPVLLTHGWPSTFLELLPLADLLDIDVVIPSLPGYLWSELLDSPVTRQAIGESFHRLMTETLGYERYVAFGGDIGGSACGWAAALHPESVAGLHVIHGPFPAEWTSPPTREEQHWLDSEGARDEHDGGYGAILSGRPDALATAVTDSPAGLASFVIDKLWAWSDCRGDIETRFSRDDLCTMLTLFWATGSIGTSFQQDLDAALGGRRPIITVPVAVTQSREWNMPLFPRSIAERAATDIRRYLPAPSGGHFLAFEEPRLIADELTAFVRELG